MAKPTFLLVPGAWHPPTAYAPLMQELESKGFETTSAVLETVGAHKGGKTWADDVNSILAVAEPLFNDGKEVILIVHSYGGIPGCAATKNQGVAERAARGLKGGFQEIFLIAAFAIPQAGLDGLKAMGGRYGDFCEHSEPYSQVKIPPPFRTSKTEVVVIFANLTKSRALLHLNSKAKNTFYQDIPNEQAEALLATLAPHSQDSMETPVDHAACDITIPKSYMICEKDNAIPLAAQEAWSSITPGFKVVRIDSSHSPFQSKPKECAELILATLEPCS